MWLRLGGLIRCLREAQRKGCNPPFRLGFCRASGWLVWAGFFMPCLSLCGWYVVHLGGGGGSSGLFYWPGMGCLPYPIVCKWSDVRYGCGESADPGALVLSRKRNGIVQCSVAFVGMLCVCALLRVCLSHVCVASLAQCPLPQGQTRACRLRKPIVQSAALGWSSFGFG